ncbi:MAG: hypothetical protein IKX16_07795 [Clostridia bacterium]|nr:hypothetical protein [Clostridia bacterium]
MFKKSVSFLLLGFMLLTSIPFSVAFAQSEEEYISSVPIVEFSTSRSITLTDYSSARIISVKKSIAKSANISLLRALVDEDRIVFFEGMVAKDVIQLTGIEGICPTDASSEYTTIGTCLTYSNGAIHYIDLFANDVNKESIELSLEEKEYCIREVYKEEKVFGFNKGGLSSEPSDDIHTHNIYLYSGSTRIGRMSATAYLKNYGKLNVNGKKRSVYDVAVSYRLIPNGNRRAKEMGLCIGCNSNVSHSYSIDETKIKYDNYTNSVTFGLGYSQTGLNIGLTREWSYGIDAFNCINDFSDPTSIKWTVTPINADKNDSWRMEPAVRFVTDLSHAEVWVGFKGTLTGTWFLDPSRVGTFLLHYYVPLNGK